MKMNHPKNANHCFSSYAARPSLGEALDEMADFGSSVVEVLACVTACVLVKMAPTNGRLTASDHIHLMQYNSVRMIMKANGWYFPAQHNFAGRCYGNGSVSCEVRTEQPTRHPVWRRLRTLPP
jgi:hypothetical protein